MSQPEGTGESAKLAPITRRDILDNLDLPMVLIIADREVAVAGHFLVTLRNRGCDVVGV